MKRFLLVAACLVWVLAIAIPASAVTLTIDDVIGTAVESVPANTDAERLYANQLITMYNGGPAGPPGFDLTLTLINPHEVDFDVYAPNYDDFGAPIPAATGGSTLGATGPWPTAGWTYLYAKLGNNGVLFWLGGATSVDGFGDLSSLPLEGGIGTSHVTLFTPTRVPEPMTLLMLGFGLVGMGMFRRFAKQ